MSAPPRLSVVPPQGDPYEHTFEGDELIIGRASDAGLPLADRFLSRHHARLFRDGDRILVEDLGSRNGTVVNGQVIQSPTEVRAGDVIKICGSMLSLIDERGGVPAAMSKDTGVSGVTVYRNATELLQSGATSSEHADEGDLRRYAERLQLINEVHKALGRSMESAELLELILDGAFRHLRPEEGAIYLQQPDGEMTLAASRSPTGGTPLYSRSLVHEVTEKCVAALVYDAQMDERFASAQSILTSGVRSLAAAPLLDEKGSLGMMVLGSRIAVRAFSEEDLELLVSLASVAALRLRNVRLAEEAAERRALAKELALARHIQTRLLPSQLPQAEGYALHGGTVPSQTVSGDMYQVVERQEGELVLMVADVSGKGIAASLLTASLEALAAVALEVWDQPEEICRRVSSQLYQRTPPEKYATAFLAVLSPEDGRLTYTNAGHNPALLVRNDGTVEELGATGTPLGLLPGAAYQARSVSLAAGDTLVVYTDGVTEAANPEDDEYGTPRLAELCRERRALALPELSRAVEEDMGEFARGVPFADDVTKVFVRRL